MSWGSVNAPLSSSTDAPLITNELVIVGLIDSAVAIAPEARAELLLVDLTERGERQCVDELQALRRMHRALAFAHEGDQLRLRHRRAGRAHDESRDGLAPLGVWDPDDRRGADIRVRFDDILHFAGIDVEPARDHHVLLSISQVEEVLVVETADVAGVQPPVPQRLRGQLRLPPVTVHDERSAYADLPHLARRNRLVVLVEDGHIDRRMRLAAGGEE